MGLIPDDLIAEVRERVDIVAVIGEHVQLKKSGVNHKGLCPFHNEKSPSFHVNQVRHSFYCFGCQKKGDVFKFLMELQGKSFPEALKEMAGRVGVTIPEEAPSAEEAARKNERGRLFDLNAQVAAYYRNVLDHGGGQGRAYLQGRGIGEEVAQGFQLGMAPDAWDGLSRHLASSGHSLHLAQMLGLVAPRKEKEGFFDKFRNRLMCPVIMPAGEIAGFSGRTLAANDPETPKYVNSPESPIYKKSSLLFGLHAARPAFQKKKRALLVEGNFDVIALHQAGFTEAVAPLGTALTDQQVETLRRLTSSVILCLDGDKAGRAAALRSIPLLVHAEIPTRVVVLPDGEDPDSFIRKNGVAALEDLIGKARSATDHMIDDIRSHTDHSPESITLAMQQAAPLISAIKISEQRELTIEQFARGLNFKSDLVRSMLRAVNHGQNPVQATVSAPAQPNRGQPPPSAELKVFAILADHPDLMAVSEELGIRSLLTDARLRDMYSAAQQGQSFLEAAPSDISNLVATQVMGGSYAAVANPRRTLDEAVRQLQREQLSLEDERLARAIKEADRAGDSARARELSMTRFETRKKAEQLKRRPEEESR